MAPTQKKIIQKRVARRERFARMARLRYRKTGDVPIAKVQDLDLPPKYVPQNQVYESQLGFMISEVDGVLDNDVSLLNFNYTSNSVTVLNDTNKLVCIKLHKNDHRDVKLNEGVIQEWEKRNDPYWVEWAKHFKEMRETHGKFVEKNKAKFENGKLDEEAQQRYREYCAKRDNIMAKGASMEIRTRFDSKNASCSELIINSGFVNKLNYEFDEFVQKVLMEGIPRFRPEKNYNNKRLPGLFKNFENMFSSSFEFKLPESYFIGKNMNIKKVDYTLLSSGYFVKNAAEMSFIFTINNSTSLLDHEDNYRPIYRLFLEQQMVHDNEKKFFLESFYPEQIKQLANRNNKICTIREIANTIESEEETNENELSSDSGKMSEELALRETDTNSDISNRDTIAIPGSMNGLMKHFIPHLQMIKGLYENKQQLLNMMMQQNVSKCSS